MSYGVPGLTNMFRRTIRAPQNPLDKSTIVSVYPMQVIERKHTIEPGYFKLDAAIGDDISILIIGPSSWWKDIDPEQPLLEIPNSSIQVADSFVRDYCNGLFMCDMSTAMPGLFYIPGCVSKVEKGESVPDYPATKAKILKENQDQILKARTVQKQWYQNLVGAADALWARSNGNPLAISGDMKMAATELGLKDKGWIKDFHTATSMSSCPACGALRNTNFPICQVCKTVIDRKRYDELKLQQAV